jgi:hypothetical protein
MLILVLFRLQYVRDRVRLLQDRLLILSWPTSVHS